MAIMGHCGCCGNTILAAVLPTGPRDGPVSWRPLMDTKPSRSLERNDKNRITRIMCPWRSCSGNSKWQTRSNESNERSRPRRPFALYTKIEPTPLITGAHVEQEDLLQEDLLQETTSTEQERRLGIAGKAIQAPSKLLRVGVDVDEVLGSFLASLNTFIAEEYLLQHNVSEYYVYDFMKIWRCSQTEANDRVHAFFESEHFNSGIIPIPGAFQTLRQLASYCHLVVVTSRQHVIRQPTMDWINQHYGGIFEEVHFGNHFALEGEARSKSEICRSLGVEVLIDDNPKYALECADHGIEVLLFDLHGNYPWSKTAQGPTHPLISRVHDWSEVEQALLTRVQ